LNISVVIPSKDEEESIPELTQWISRVMKTHGFSYEVIFIDDGSTDKTWSIIQEASAIDPNVKGIRFNRNFGKSAALNTGFRIAQGDIVITMDSDLQDSPEEIPKLFEMMSEGKWDLISGWKKKRHDPISKTLPSKFFNALTRRMSGIQLHDFNCGLKAYRNVVVKNITVYGEMHRYIPLLAKWAGFKRITEKVVEHHERKYGHSKFGLERMRGVLDVLTITFLGKFARRPMHFFGSWGVVSFLVGLILTIKIIGEKLYTIWFLDGVIKRDVTDQPAFYLALVFVVLGTQLFLTGFIAELVARQSLSKRDYLVIESVGIEKAEVNR
jgi:glycosyltransferase involved in cell wall biosynthesis